MILLSLYEGVPATLESGLEQYERLKAKFRKKDYWFFGFWHKGYLALKKIERGKYKGCFGVYQYEGRPNTKTVKLSKI